MLSVLHEKLGEAHGLAMAAVTVTEHVQERTDDAALFVELRRMRDEAEEARARCLAAEREFEPERADEILAHANTIKEKAGDLLGAWFKAGTGPLAAWSFLAMGRGRRGGDVVGARAPRGARRPRRDRRAREVGATGPGASSADRA